MRIFYAVAYRARPQTGWYRDINQNRRDEGEHCLVRMRFGDNAIYLQFGLKDHDENNKQPGQVARLAHDCFNDLIPIHPASTLDQVAPAIKQEGNELATETVAC